MTSVKEIAANKQTQRQGGAFVVWLAAFLGAALALYATSAGVGLAHDSLEYVGCARCLLQGQGLSAPGDDARLAPLTHFPPMTTLFLAGAGEIAGGPLAAARWAVVALLMGNLLVIGAMVRAVTPNVHILLAILLLAATSSILLPLHIIICSEPLYFLLGFGGLLALNHWLRQGEASRNAGWFIVAAICLALVVITRYAGVAFPIAGCLGILFDRRAAFTRRLRNVAIIGVAVMLPLAAWVYRNHRLQQQATGRAVVFHPITAIRLGYAKQAMEQWVLPKTPNWPLLHGSPIRAMALLVMAAAVAAVITLFTTRSAVNAASEGATSKRRPAPLLGMLGAFIILHLAVLLVTMFYFDASIVLDGRMLSPVYVALFPLAARGADWLLRRGRGRDPAALRARQPLSIALSVVWAGVFASYVMSAVPLVQGSHTDPTTYASAAWRHSPLMAYLRNLPSSAAIYSNASEATWFLGDRLTFKLPAKFDRLSMQPNSGYPAQIERLAQLLAQTRGGIAFFSQINRDDLPTPREIMALVPRLHATTFEDGTFYTQMP